MKTTVRILVALVLCVSVLRGEEMNLLEESYRIEKLSWFDGRTTGFRNVLPNSSFEVGFSGWKRLNTGIGDNDVVWNIDDTTAVQGARSIRIHHESDTSASELKSDLVRLEAEGSYTVSAYLKTDNPEISVILCGRYVSVTTEWKRYDISFDNLPPEVWDAWRAGKKEGEPRLRSAFIGVYGKGNVWVDAVQLEKGELTDYASVQKVELGVDTGKIHDLFADNESVTLPVSVFNGTGQQADPVISYVVKDFRKVAVARGKINFRGIAPGKGATRELRLPIEGKGVFQASFSAESVETLPKNIWLPFGRISFLSNRNVSESCYFGLCNGATAPNAWLEWSLSEAIGARYATCYGIGLHHYYFLDKFTGKSNSASSVRFTAQYVPALAERMRALMKKYGILEVNTLPRPGVFWSNPTPDELTPEVIDAWAKSVAGQAQALKGTTRYWEIPPETLGEGSQAGIYHAKEYIKMLKAGYEAIKGADPSAVVIGGGNNDFQRLADDAEALLKLGGGDYMDAWSIHPYCWSDPESAGYRRELKRLKKVMKKYGFEKDIWITEVGWCGADRVYNDLPDFGKPGLTSERGQAEYMVKANVIAMSEGIKHFLAFMLAGHGYGFFDDYYNSPKAVLGAYAHMTEMLRGAVFGAGVNMGGIVTVYRFEKEGRPLVVMWNPDKYEPVVLTIPVGRGKVQVSDMMGNPAGRAGRELLELEVTGSPVYICGTGISAEALEQALQQSKVSDRNVLDITADLERYRKNIILTITNRSPQNLSGTVNFVFPEEWKVMTSQVEYGPLPPGESERRSFSLQQVSMFEPYTLKASYVHEGKTLNQEIRLVNNNIVARKVSRAPVFGQNDELWKQASVLAMGTEEVAVTTGVWKGAGDLSAALSALWDDKNLFFRVAVTDDEFNQPYTEGGVWQGDSLQFVFDGDNNRQWKGEKDYEYGIALTPKGTQAYRWAGNGGAGLAGEVVLHIEKKPGTTVYEIAFPFTSLGWQEPQPGDSLPVNLAVNDNDQGKYEKWLQLSPGVVGTVKDVSMARLLLFVD